MLSAEEFIFRFNPKRVPIWDFYNVNYDYDMAVCKVCRKIIKTRRRDGTRNVLSHMRNLHPSMYALSLQFKERWKSMKQKQCLDFYKKKLTGLKRTFRETKDYDFVESGFGGHLLILSGFSYRRKSITSGKSYWFCRSVKCPAKGILNADGKFQVTNFKHNHEPDFENIRKKEKLIELKKLALQMNASGQELLEALNIKDNVKKYLNFIRACRRRDRRKRNQHLIPVQAPLSVGLNYKRLPSRIPSKEMLLYSGEFFRQDSVNPLNKKCKYWRCKMKNCKARAKTDDIGNLTILNPIHNHALEENEKISEHLGQMLKTESSTSRKSACEITDEHNTKRDDFIKFRWKIRKKIERQKQEKLETAKDLSSPMEETNSAFYPSTVDSENFSFEKLVAETLAEDYCVTNEFSEPLNLLKDE